MSSLLQKVLTSCSSALITLLILFSLRCLVPLARGWLMRVLHALKKGIDRAIPSGSCWMRSLAGAFLVACILFCGYLSGSKRPAVSAGHVPRETPVAHRAGGEAHAEEADMNVLRFTAATVQMEGVYLSAAWPDGLIAAGSTLDLLGKASLDQPHWTWVTNVAVQTAQTNAAWRLPFAIATTNRFFKLAVRETLSPMDDSDGDGLDDSEETARGTDPADIRSFFRRIVVSVTNTEENVWATDCIAWGSSPTGWEANGVWSFTGAAATNVWEMDATLDALYVKAFRDLDGDGIYTPGSDVLVVKALDALASVQHVSFSFGDVDGDGVKDRDELVAGTDPYDRQSYPLTCEVVVENRDVVQNVTNHVVLSASATVAQGRELGVSQDRTKSFRVDTIVTNDTCYVLCWRDFDGDGVFTPDVDALYKQPLSSSSNGTKVTFPIGDRDDDGVTDCDELRAGTDWSDIKNYSHRLSLTYTDVFQTTNALTFEARFGANTVWGPAVVRAQTWTHDFGELSTTNHEHASVSVWDDANGNGLWDPGETSNRYEIAVTGLDMTVTNRLAYGNFDLDADGIPDWWEVAHANAGLSPTNAADALLDADGDGLINLHEFWTGYDPGIPDGSNTLFSILSRSVDDRIANIDPAASVNRFNDFYVNGSNGVFQLNTNFWARDFDLSCVSVWNDGSEQGSMCATAITRRHVIMSFHWKSSHYIFCDTNGICCVRNIINTYQASTDLVLGRLDQDLPESFRPAKVLPANIGDYLSSGRYLPTICLNQVKAATVLELKDLNCATTDRYNRYFTDYCYTSATNKVSIKRSNVRGVTDDGNSSTPAFFVDGNDLILVSAKHLGRHETPRWGEWWGPSVAHWANGIQQQIDLWEGAAAFRYKLEYLDVGRFGRIINR